MLRPLAVLATVVVAFAVPAGAFVAIVGPEDPQPGRHGHESIDLEVRDLGRTGNRRARERDVAPDQGEPHAGHRLQAEAFQDMDVGVTPANQHKVLEEGHRLHRDPYIRSEGALVRL